MYLPSFVRRFALLTTMLLASGCVVYRYAPPTAGLTPAQRRWSDSVASLREADLARILVDDAGQRRPRLVRNPVLDSVARARAWDMATRGYFDHVNPEGWGPNALVEAAGYRLPLEYDRRRTGNDIEAAAAGYATARQAWRWFMRSPLHRTPAGAERARTGADRVRHRLRVEAAEPLWPLLGGADRPSRRRGRRGGGSSAAGPGKASTQRSQKRTDEDAEAAWSLCVPVFRLGDRCVKPSRLRTRWKDPPRAGG